MKNDPAGDKIQQDPDQQAAEVPIPPDAPQSAETNSKSNEQKNTDIDILKNRLRSDEKWAFIFSGLIALASLINVGIAFFQLSAMRNQFQWDQRPYVISLSMPLVLIPNQRIMFDYLNGNYGKSPAIKAGGIAGIFLGDDALQRADLWFNNEAQKVFSRRNETIIPPNTPASNIEARRTTASSIRPVSDEELNSLMKKDFSIVVVMRQVYLDGAGNQYWTDSCISNLATGAIVECNTHNEIH